MESGQSANNKVIFIVGASRSGTTMLSRILGKHTTIFALNELHVFGDLITVDSLQKVLPLAQQRALAETVLRREEHGIWGAGKALSKPRSVKAVVDKLEAQACTGAAVFRESVLHVAHEHGKQHAAEQTPRNIFFAEALLKAYTQAHVVHMVRDPRAVLASQKNKWRRKFLGGSGIPLLEMIRMWTNYHPITLSKLWVNANRVATNLDTHDRFHVLKFEQLLASPKECLNELCQSMGLGFEEQMMDIDHVGSSHQHNVSKASGISSTTAESWRNNLSPAEQWVSEKMCAEVMKHFGYDSADRHKAPILSMLLLLLRFPVHVAGVALFNFKRAVIQVKSMFGRAQD